jgi:endonuclease G
MWNAPVWGHPAPEPLPEFFIRPCGLFERFVMSRIGNPFAALVSRLQRARVEDQSIAPRTRSQPAPTPSETTPARPTTFSPTSLDAAHTARVGFNQADRLRANLFSMFRPAAAPTAAPTAATSAAAAAGNTQTLTYSPA